jgi:hypothetical protein
VLLRVLLHVLLAHRTRQDDIDRLTLYREIHTRSTTTRTVAVTNITVTVPTAHHIPTMATAPAQGSIGCAFPRTHTRTHTGTFVRNVTF